MYRDNNDPIAPAKPLTVRDKLNQILNFDLTFPPAIPYMIINLLVVLLSAILFIVSSLPEFWDNPPSSFFILETIAIIYLTLDYIIRLIFAKQNRLLWIINAINLCDLLSILPYYIELIFKNFQGMNFLVVFRILRMIRIFKVIQIGKFFKSGHVILIAFRKSIGALLILLYIIVFSITVFSTAIFYAEQTMMTFNSTTKTWFYDDGFESQFQSIPASFWWCIATLTTVGYGDIVPRTPLGKLVAGVTMIIGVLTLAFPVSIITSNFSRAYAERFEKKRKNKNKSRRKERIDC